MNTERALEPVDDAIRCYEFLKERIGSEITDNAEEFEKWFERMVWHVQKCNEHDTEMRNVSEDCISRQDAINVFTKDLTRKERRNLLHTWSTVEVKYYIIEMLGQLTSAEPERPKGKYIKGQNGEYYCSVCKRIDDKYSVARYCWYCGADMRGDKDE